MQAKITAAVNAQPSFIIPHPQSFILKDIPCLIDNATNPSENIAIDARFPRFIGMPDTSECATASFDILKGSVVLQVKGLVQIRVLNPGEGIGRDLNGSG